MVTRVRIGLGGVAATPIRALRTELALAGQPWTEETVEAAAAVLAEEGTPIDDQRALGGVPLRDARQQPAQAVGRSQ